MRAAGRVKAGQRLGREGLPAPPDAQKLIQYPPRAAVGSLSKARLLHSTVPIETRFGVTSNLMFLVERGGIYYVRLTVPKALRRCFPVSELR